MHESQGVRGFLATIESLQRAIGSVVAWLTLFMVLLTVVIVVLRKGFGLGWIGMQEAVVWMHALVIFLGVAFTLIHDDHVRVDIFYRRYSPAQQQWVNRLGALLLLLPVCITLLITSWDYVLVSWQIGEASQESGGLPGLFLLKSGLLLMPILLSLQALAMAITGRTSMMESAA